MDGPYRVRSATLSTVTFERNPHWNILTRPALNQITLHYYPTDPQLLSAVQSGQVDLSQGFQEIDIAKGILPLSSLGGLKLKLYPTAGIEHLEPNLLGRTVGRKHLNFLTNVKVRQALNLVINRSAMLNGAQSALDFPPSAIRELPAYGPEMPGRFDGLAVHGMWDPIKGRFVTSPQVADANKLLNEAGWPVRTNGWRYRTRCKASAPGCQLLLEFLVPKLYFNRLWEATFLAQEWKQIHVQVHINSYEWGIGNLLASYNESGPCARGWFDLCLFAQLPGTDPQTDFQLVFPSDRSARLNVQNHKRPRVTDLNFPGVRDGLIDHVFAVAPHSYDLMRRRALYREWQVEVAKKAYWIPLFQQPLIVVQRKAVANFAPAPAGAEWNPWELGS